MPSRTLESTVAWGLILAWANGAAAQSVDLRPKFTTGRVTYYRKITNDETKTTDEGRQKSTTEFGFRCTVKDVHPDGSAELELTLLYVAAVGGTPQNPSKFDSRRSKGSPPSSRPQLQFLNMLVDKPLVLSVAADGTIGRLTGYKQIDTGALPPILAGMFSEDLLRAEYETLFGTRKAPVPTEVGAKWENESTTVTIPLLGGGFKQVTAYTLKSIDPSTRRAKIGMNAVLRWEASAGAGPMRVSIEDGKGSGRMTWDLAAGELVKAAESLQMTMTMTLTMTMGSRARNDPKDPPPLFSVEVSSTATLERVKLEDLHLPADKAKRGRKPLDK